MAATAGLMGAALARNPGLALASVGAVALVAALILLPLRGFVAAVIIGVIAVPSFVLAREQAGMFSQLPIGGQSTVVILLCATCLGRLVFEHRALRFPVGATVAIAAFVGGVVFTAVVAGVIGNSYAGMGTDLRRQLAYPLAFLIGLVARESVSGTGRMKIYRAVAWVGITAGALAIVYWAWTAGLLAAAPPGLTWLFRLSQSSSVFARDRSIFPFVEDSPNLGAVALLALGSFGAPPLLMSKRSRDRRLGVALAVVIAAAVLTTQSRTGLVAVALVPLIYLMLLPAGAARRRAAVGVVVLLALVFQGYRLYPSERALSTKTQTFVLRQNIWRQASTVFFDHPLLGEGYQYSVRGHFIEYEPNPAAGAPSYRAVSVHNEYLGQLVDGGIVAGLIFVFLLSMLLRMGRAMTRAPDARGEGIAYLCLLVTLMLSMLVNASLESSAVAILFFLFTGVAGGAFLQLRRADADVR